MHLDLLCMYTFSSNPVSWVRVCYLQQAIFKNSVYSLTQALLEESLGANACRSVLPGLAIYSQIGLREKFFGVDLDELAMWLYLGY